MDEIEISRVCPNPESARDRKGVIELKSGFASLRTLEALWTNLARLRTGQHWFRPMSLWNPIIRLRMTLLGLGCLFHFLDAVYLGVTNTLEALEVGVGRSHCHPLPIMGMQWSGLSKPRCIHCTDVLSNFLRSLCTARVRKGNEVARRPRWRSKSWFTW